MVLLPDESEAEVMVEREVMVGVFSNGSSLGGLKNDAVIVGGDGLGWDI